MSSRKLAVVKEEQPQEKQRQSLKIRIDDLKTFDPLTDNQKQFFDAYRRGDYFIALHGVAGTGNDIADVVSSGPFTIAAGDSIKVAFALIAGDNLADIQTSAGNAQTMWDNMNAVATGINVPSAGANALQLYPNPSNGPLTVMVQPATVLPQTVAKVVFIV